MTAARLLLGDEQTLLLEGLRRLLEPEFAVVGTCGDGPSLLQAADALRPDVVLLDVVLPQLSGLVAAERLRAANPTSRILFVTAHAEAETVQEALRVGATGYVLKRSSGAELVTAVREVLQGRLYLTPLVPVAACLREGREAREGRGALGPPTLTERQREVLQLVAAGHPDKAIASLLHVSDKTVEFHKASIRKLLGLRSTAEMTRYAIKHGLAKT
ncbi:MAG: response regulator transcription factor [Polyangia bacterium]